MTQRPFSSEFRDLSPSVNLGPNFLDPSRLFRYIYPLSIPERLCSWHLEAYEARPWTQASDTHVFEEKRWNDRSATSRISCEGCKRHFGGRLARRARSSNVWSERSTDTMGMSFHNRSIHRRGSHWHGPWSRRRRCRRRASLTISDSFAGYSGLSVYIPLHPSVSKV